MHGFQVDLAPSSGRLAAAAGRLLLLLATAAASATIPTTRANGYCDPGDDPAQCVALADFWWAGVFALADFGGEKLTALAMVPPV